jgi:hypothetical protein
LTKAYEIRRFSTVYPVSAVGPLFVHPGAAFRRTARAAGLLGNLRWWSIYFVNLPSLRWRRPQTMAKG